MWSVIPSLKTSHHSSSPSDAPKNFRRHLIQSTPGARSDVGSLLEPVQKTNLKQFHVGKKPSSEKLPSGTPRPTIYKWLFQLDGCKSLHSHCLFHQFIRSLITAYIKHRKGTHGQNSTDHTRQLEFNIPGWRNKKHLQKLHSPLESKEELPNRYLEDHLSF